MKKLSVLFAALIIAALVMGCGSSPAQQTTAAPAAAAQNNSGTKPASARPSGTPDWFEDMPPDDAFWGIGRAKLEDESQSLQVATFRARRDVAEQLSTVVQGMLIDHYRQAGTLDKPNTTAFIENIGRGLVNANLVGAAPNTRKRMDDGAYWVRVSLKKADAKKVITDTYDSEAARFAEFKAREALKMLDFELNKYQAKPTGVFED
ncbi:MAG: LPP20 family lipoprotein [Treponema sp.]|jgi:hypothetical protein|nr:LPP20 family lipoprotein [Treponema sp.]